MNASHRLIVLLLALGIVGAVGCSKTVDVGAVISRTGPGATYGDSVAKGLDLALEHINDAGGLNGKPLQLIYVDDQSHIDVGLEVTEKLISEDGVRVIIGAVTSPVTLKVAELCESKGVILLSPTASSPGVTAAGEYIYRVYPSDILEGTSMGNFARDLRLENMVVFAVDNVYGDGLRDVFSEKFQSKYRTVVKTYEFSDGDTSKFAEWATEVKDIAPDGIYIVAYDNDWAALLTALHQAGVEAVILGNAGYTRNVLDIAGEAAELMLYPQPAFDVHSDDPAMRAFVEAYRAKYGDDPNPFAAHGYDSLKVLHKAMVDGGSAHPSNLRIGLANLQNFEGASGKITFDANGDVVQYPRIFIVRGGEPVAYERFIEEGGTLPLPGRD